MSCQTPGCGHPALTHWSETESQPGACRVTGCGCRAYTALPVEDVPQPLRITFEVPPDAHWHHIEFNIRVDEHGKTWTDLGPLSDEEVDDAQAD